MEEQARKKMRGEGMHSSGQLAVLRRGQAWCADGRERCLGQGLLLWEHWEHLLFIGRKDISLCQGLCFGTSHFFEAQGAPCPETDPPPRPFLTPDSTIISKDHF